jgi:hypothetical protein
MAPPVRTPLQLLATPRWVGRERFPPCVCRPRPRIRGLFPRKVHSRGDWTRWWGKTSAEMVHLGGSPPLPLLGRNSKRGFKMRRHNRGLDQCEQGGANTTLYKPVRNESVSCRCSPDTSCWAASSDVARQRPTPCCCPTSDMVVNGVRLTSVVCVFGRGPQAPVLDPD